MYNYIFAAMEQTFLKQLLGLAFVGTITAILGVLSTWFVWDHQSGGDPLPDVTFQLLDELGLDWSDNEFPIPNVIAGIMYGLAILTIRPKHRLKIAAQFILLECILTSIRAITVMVTLLPNIHLYPYCEKRPGGFFEAMTWILTKGTCADYMFSGHTSTAFLCYMFVHKEGIRRAREEELGLTATNEKIYCDCCYEACCRGCLRCLNTIENGIKRCYATVTFCFGFNWIEVTSLILHFCLMFSLLIQRWHYTVDILVAVVITWLAFNYYKDREDMHVDAVRRVLTAKPTERKALQAIAKKTNRWYFFTRFELDLVRRHARIPRESTYTKQEDDSWRVTEARRKRLLF